MLIVSILKFEQCYVSYVYLGLILARSNLLIAMVVK